MSMIRSKSAKALSLLLGGGVLVALLIGAALNWRGSDAESDNIVQAQAVVLNDGRTLNVQTREVTVAEWQVCHAAGACDLDFSHFVKDVEYPATGLSYIDAMQYLTWVNAQSVAVWRLPTSNEWHELAAEVLPEKPDPIFTDPALTWASTYLAEGNRTGRALRPSGAFSTSSAGIEDLDGNVWEWTQDCYAGSGGRGAVTPADRCPAFVMGGEHEAVMSYLVRDPARGGCAVGAPPAHLGMRLVSDVSNS